MACEEIFELSSTGMYSRDDNSYNDFYSTKILLDLMKRTGYPVIHEPGQRVFGPPPDWNGPPPDRDSEVFIGKLPKDCFEHEILEFVLKIGPVYKIRLMTNCNGTTRGFAFVTFQSITDAEKAVKELNDTCLIRRPGVRIGVSASINNTRLIVYNMCEYFPETSFKKSIFAVLGKLNISVRALKTGTMGWLEFDSHKEAALARKELRNVSKRWLGDCTWVDWAPPVLPDYTAKNLEYNDQAQISTMLRREISLSQNTTNDFRAIKGVASATPQLHQFFDQNDLPQFSENLFKITDSNIYHFDFELTDTNNSGNNNVSAISLKHKNKNLYETDLFYFKSIASSSSISSQTSSSAFSLPVETVSSNLPITSSRISCGLITLDSPDLPIPVDNKCKLKIDKDENNNTLDILLAEKNSSLLWSHNLPQFDYFPQKKQYSSDGNNYNYIECLRKMTNCNNFTSDKSIYGNKHHYENIYQQPNIDVIELASSLSVQRSMKFFKNNSSH